MRANLQNISEVKMFSLIIISSVISCVLTGIIPDGLIPVLDGRIVGGQDGTIEEFPYQVSMRYFGAHRCGGSIFNQRTIITAAHCVIGVNPQAVTINAGTSFHKNTGVLKSVDRIESHPNYNAVNFDCDMAVIILKTDYFYTDTVKPVAIPNHGDALRIAATGFVSGWGTLNENGNQPAVLQYVAVNMMNHNACAGSYGRDTVFTKNMICAASLGKDACQGDSGGPLVVDNKLVGIVSWGYGCARPQYPGVYTNVASLRVFLDRFNIVG